MSISFQPPQKKRVIAHAVVVAMAACSGGGGGAPTPVPPAINNSPSLSIDAVQTIVEGQSRVAKIDASDPDGDSITLSLGGEDANLFIVSSDNFLEFISPPRSSSPDDFDLDRVYRVVITASDGSKEVSNEIEIRVEPDRLILSGRLLPSGPLGSDPSTDNKAQVHMDCNWNNEVDQFEPVVTADAAGRYELTALDTFGSESWFPCDSFWVNAGATAEARPYIELLPWRLRIFGGVMVITSEPNNKIFRAAVQSPGRSVFEDQGVARSSNVQLSGKDPSATHYEIEIIAGDVFLAVWDGAIDLTVDTFSGGETVSFGDGEDFSFGLVTEDGEVTTLLESPESFSDSVSDRFESANETVSQGLGLDAGDLDRARETDTWEEASSDESAAEIQQKNLALNVVLTTLETLHEDLDPSDRSDLAYQSLNQVLDSTVTGGEVFDVSDAEDVTQLLTASYEEREESDLPPPPRVLSEEELSAVGESVAVVTAVLTDPSVSPTSDTASDLVSVGSDDLQVVVEDLVEE
ncbi:cadherin repeat domain-containing protein, partial [Luminiphilus sp.]|nr:cadherin repeat domain-containing protein [Luminiphilus sp.]